MRPAELRIGLRQRLVGALGFVDPAAAQGTAGIVEGALRGRVDRRFVDRRRARGRGGGTPSVSRRRPA